MKQPTAPSLYPELPVEDGQNYRLQKISEIEQTLIKERDTRQALYKKYKKGINLSDGIDTTLISGSIIIGGIGIAIPLLLPLEVGAAVVGITGICVKFIRRRLHIKAMKHYEIKTLAESKLNSVKDIVSKALQDGKISEIEFKTVLDEMEKYHDLKDSVRQSKNSEISEVEKKKLIEQGRTEAMNTIQKRLKAV